VDYPDPFEDARSDFYEEKRYEVLSPGEEITVGSAPLAQGEDVEANIKGPFKDGEV